MLLFNQTGKGTYWRAMGFARTLVPRGHAITLVCTSPGARFRIIDREVDGIRLVEMPDLMPRSLRFGWDPWNTLRRLIWLREKEFDLVHSFETRPVCIYAALAAHRNGARLFLDWCDWFGQGGSVEERPKLFVRNILRPVETYFENHFRTAADGTTVINSFLRQRAIDLGVKAETIRMIHNGSDISIQPMDRLDARRSLGLSLGDPIIGFVGGTFSRDAQFMATAFNQVLAQRPQTKLLLVGNFNRAIENWISNANSIVRSGAVDSAKLYTCLSACDVCWLPLTDTGANRGRWPFKLNDYMTIARPVVATAVGEYAEIIQRYGLGVTTPVNTEQFAEETLMLLKDEKRACAIGLNARQVAQNIFSWEKLTDELEAFYMAYL